ncbi:SusC/RagA family TonB-linked outer membrane protein [Petrimonas mucosa]|jgi:TonB-linked SusC/RagA family outer membrane protein|uniref:TonB-dependent receptor SusC n=1 Tax=Petrimonas mucosa TaxID=1642646 RepID=A0A1G4G962_9BACT|nr:SusC/RagA family TonB-linked outer membrane protein [Petrimonas mucosa]SCM59052.1 TonB-dependent receptor SusC [Petrimonas mucosa]SFU26977.1 TonB-linked outer membrane protein, SusC/RagA family [Porphyromonadaceae bacterium KHP3R9]
MKRIIVIITSVLICFFMTVPSVAQNKNNILNRIVNKYNQPVKDALIETEDGKYISKTASDGTFRLPAEYLSEAISISADGYLNSRVTIADLPEEGDVVLAFDPHGMGGKVNYGYLAQTKESVTGAVATVSGAILDKTPSNVLSDTYEGRLPGLTVINNIAELTFFGYGNFSKSIRGYSSINGNTPLVIIDGVIAPTQYIEFISPKEIESIAVLKDASATAAYGIQGSAGVIVITTKRGHDGSLNVEAYADQSFQQQTRKPLFINSAQYATLRNEAAERDGLAPYSQFSQEEIDLFRAGDDPRYPNNNWYDMFIKDVVMRQRVGVNVSGGTEKFRYYSNLSFVHQEEPFKIVDEPNRKYDPTPNVNIGNFRTNMDVRFNNYISGYMRLTGNVKREVLAGGNLGWNIYSQIFNQPPTMYGPLSPVNEENPDLSEQVVTVDGVDNPVYGMLNRSGYRTVIETNILAQTGLKFDLGFLTKGLSLSGGMAYQTYVRNETGTTQSYKRLIRESDFSTLDNFVPYKTFENTPLSYNKSAVFFYYLNFKGSIDYSRRFGDHSIDASAHTYYLRQEKEAAGSSNSVLPYKRQNFGVTALYGYKDRYYLKGDMGYSGSEQFHPDNRYSTTPAISGAWIASNEDFFTSSLISLLKLRASYGISGNDQLGDSRFLYLDNIRSDGSELERGNPSLEAEKIKKLNLGINLGLLNRFTVDFDYFKDHVDNMLINSNYRIPEYQGIPLGYFPKLNGGVMENKGFELSLGYRTNLTEEFSIFAQANMMQAVNKVIDINEAPLGSDYAYPLRTEGYSIGQLWGYKIDRSNGNGMFNSLEELDASGLTYSFGNPRVGDFIYTDLNNDGIIDEKDKAPLGYGSLPQQEFSLTGGFQWKNWDFSFLLHGISKCSQFLSGVGAYESLGKGIFNDIHLKAWTPERYAAGEEITFPALSLSPSTNHVANDFFLSDRSYLRLRNVELAYSLPQHLSKKITAENIRVALNIQNLLTFDKMKSKYIDPEIGSMNTFQPYRVFNIGISANF